MIKGRRQLFYIAAMAFIMLLTIIGAAAETLSVRVEKAVDGDTLRLKDGRLVRYLGIDAPEIDHRDNLTDPYGLEAFHLNAEYVDNKTVVLEFDQEHRDHYGRLLAYVFTRRGILVNQALLEKGLAYVLYNPLNIQHFDVLLNAQRFAIKHKVGIWDDKKKGQGPYIGNTRSKRFHLNRCRFGQKIPDSHRIIFKDLSEAYWRGYAPCAYCMPSPIRKIQQIRKGRGVK